MILPWKKDTIKVKIKSEPGKSVLRVRVHLKEHTAMVLLRQVAEALGRDKEK